jgi:hypothetical protein
MNIKKSLKAFMAVITGEADRNPEFAQKLAMALGFDNSEGEAKRSAKRRGRRRTPAVLDPVALYSEGEGMLREKLGALNIEQLKDIVAECGMDPGKLVMKWKTEQRVINHIVEVAGTRAKKGEAFR